MAHIFKHPSAQARGIVVLTHKELKFLKKLEKQPFWRGKNQSLERLKALKETCFIGIHYGWFQPEPVSLPDWVHFAMAAEGTASFESEQLVIPMSSAHFTPTVMSPTDVVKYWDVVCVAKAAFSKRLPEFLSSIRKIYDSGRKFRVLLLVASNRGEKDAPKAYSGLVDDYYEMFNASERELFTLLKTDAELGFQGLSYPMVAHFLNQSKVFTLFSKKEGESRATKEALLCGLPVVMFGGMQGGALDDLDDSNSVQFADYDDAHLALIEAVERYDAGGFDLRNDALREEYGDTASRARLRAYFTELYARHGAEFDGELINTDNLNRRLPAHFFDPGISWAAGPEFRFTTTDIVNEEMLNAFLDRV